MGRLKTNVLEIYSHFCRLFVPGDSGPKIDFTNYFQHDDSYCPNRTSNFTLPVFVVAFGHPVENYSLPGSLGRQAKIWCANVSLWNGVVIIKLAVHWFDFSEGELPGNFYSKKNNNVFFLVYGCLIFIEYFRKCGFKKQTWKKVVHAGYFNAGLFFNHIGPGKLKAEAMAYLPVNQ